LVPPTDREIVLCAGQNPVGLNSTTSSESQTNSPAGTGDDVNSMLRCAASRFATGAPNVTVTG
jgi:hypothetical protein